MDKIPSFTIDHCRLQRGIYVSRQDQVGGETVTTFDIRMKLPNREPALGQGPSTPLSIWLPPICATTPSGVTASSIGGPWDASPATTCS